MNSTTRCSLCNVVFKNADLIEHLGWLSHIRKSRREFVRWTPEHYKRSVVISSNFPMMESRTFQGKTDEKMTTAAVTLLQKLNLCVGKTRAFLCWIENPNFGIVMFKHAYAMQNLYNLIPLRSTPVDGISIKIQLIDNSDEYIVDVKRAIYRHLDLHSRLPKTAWHPSGTSARSCATNKETGQLDASVMVIESAGGEKGHREIEVVDLDMTVVEVSKKTKP